MNLLGYLPLPVFAELGFIISGTLMNHRVHTLVITPAVREEGSLPPPRISSLLLVFLRLLLKYSSIAKSASLKNCP